jgi:hypothetical protein
LLAQLLLQIAPDDGVILKDDDFINGHFVPTFAFASSHAACANHTGLLRRGCKFFLR